MLIAFATRFCLCATSQAEHLMSALKARDGSKTELQRWSVPSDKFGASADMIQMLEQKFAVCFDRIDMSAIRTFEEFEKHGRERLVGK